MHDYTEENSQKNTSAGFIILPIYTNFWGKRTSVYLLPSLASKLIFF